jgi:TolA-binding protein
MPHRNHSAFSSTEFERLKNELESATKAAIIVRDSLASLQQFIESELANKNFRVNKVNELKSKEILTTTKQIEFKHNVAEFQSEGKESSPQLAEVRTQVFASNMNTASSVLAHASVSSYLKNEYAEGLSFFKQRRYGEAISTFNDVLNKGVEEDIADNCEYWIGECHFARREYTDAINYFQKVLSIESSNKKIDAYFMLGKAYEQIGDVEKARVAYKVLNVRYPNNGHTQIVKNHLDALKHKLYTHRIIK